MLRRILLPLETLAPALLAGRKIGLTVALCLTVGVAPAHAAYEPFDYPANAAINNQAGGKGWGGPWLGCGSVVVAPGLTYPGLVPIPTGNSLGPTPGNACTRTLPTPVLGAQGTSVVLRALVRSDVNGTPASQATLGNLSGGTFIIGDLPQQDADAGEWGLQTTAGRFYSNVPVVANDTVYLVAQIDFDVSGSGSSDRMRLWVNPPAAYFTVAPQIDVTNADVGQFSGVFWQTQQQQRVDEISVETTKTSCVPPPNTTMVGWYPFDEPAGPLALNLATANDGVHVSGPTPIQGIVAGALHFDGLDDYVESPSSIATNFGPAGVPLNCSGTYSTCRGDFSIDTWIRVDPSSLTSTIVDKRTGSPPAINGYSLFLFGGSFGVQLADGIGTGWNNFLSSVVSPSLGDGNWHHIAVTVRRRVPTPLIRYYHNGVPIPPLNSFSANPGGRQGSLVNNSPLRIGTRTAAAPLTGFFEGDLDELEIYNRFLTRAEVRSIFNAGPFGKCK